MSPIMHGKGTDATGLIVQHCACAATVPSVYQGVCHGLEYTQILAKPDNGARVSV
jgi:hypothetical protein